MPLVKQTNLFNVNSETGELEPVSSATHYKGSMLGDDWVVVYTRALERLLELNASYTALRIFLKLMSLQTFGKTVKIQKKYLYESLGLCRNSFCKALKWLKDNNFLKELEEDGQNAFLLNPEVTTRGTDSLPGKRLLWSMKLN